MKRRITAMILTLALTLTLAPLTAMPAMAAADDVTLKITVRDFKADGLLIEGEIYDGEGLVQKTLGADKKPVFVLSEWQELYGAGVTQDMLNAFFNDVSGKNMKAEKNLVMRASAQEGYYEINSAYDEHGEPSPGFFPIDNELFGNEENEHNFHFSVEIHTKFKYVKGAEFEFSGDDDFWIFFNGKLVLDLGGVHSNVLGSISVDEIASSLGIKIGDVVDFDLFYMERHLDGSNLHMTTNFEFMNINASSWADEWMQKADDLGLIPESLRYEDLTKAMNREEFCEIVLLLYEKMMNVTTTPISPNPFTDTSNPSVLKAKNVGIVSGRSDTIYDPKTLINRQECATMLFNALKVIAPSNPFDIEGVRDFPDQAEIDWWAVPGTKYMFKEGIITGDDRGYFMPKKNPSISETYGMATREAGIILAVKTLEAKDKIIK